METKLPALLKNVLAVIAEIANRQHDYYDDFEIKMLSQTSAYYIHKALQWVSSGSLTDYLLKVRESLEKEEDRASHYIRPSSMSKLLKEQLQTLLKYVTQLLENKDLDNKVEGLSRVYRFTSKTACSLEPAKDISKDIFIELISDESTLLVKKADQRKKEEKGNVMLQEFVSEVIELHDKFMAYVNDCFLGDMVFHEARKKAFEGFFEKKVCGYSMAILLANFCHDILKRGGSEELNDEAIEKILEKVVGLLAYSKEIHLFGRFYTTKLHWRLLYNQSANNLHERIMMTKLRNRYWGEFSWKLEKMVFDLGHAREKQPLFKEYLAENPNANPGINLTVDVLRWSSWPNLESSDLLLSAEMFKCVEAFTNFYQTTEEDRKLSWIHSLGSCELIIEFEQQTVQLMVTTYQAAVLLLFNASNELTYRQISLELNLSDDASGVLYSLSCDKYPILNKRPDSEIISEDDIFYFNSDFTDRRAKIKMPLPSVAAKKKFMMHVEKDRRRSTDSTIVTIIRSRESTDLLQLVDECYNRLSQLFNPDRGVIRKRIDRLSSDGVLDIERGKVRYLAR